MCRDSLGYTSCYVCQNDYKGNQGLWGAVLQVRGLHRRVVLGEAVPVGAEGAWGLCAFHAALLGT